MITDPEAIREAFRQAVLQALDDAAKEVFDLTGVISAGAADADLPGLFRAIDAQTVRVCVRQGAHHAAAIIAREDA